MEVELRNHTYPVTNGQERPQVCRLENLAFDRFLSGSRYLCTITPVYMHATNTARLLPSSHKLGFGLSSLLKNRESSNLESNGLQIFELLRENLVLDGM